MYMFYCDKTKSCLDCVRQGRPSGSRLEFEFRCWWRLLGRRGEGLKSAWLQRFGQTAAAGGLPCCGQPSQIPNRWTSRSCFVYIVVLCLRRMATRPLQRHPASLSPRRRMQTSWRRELMCLTQIYQIAEFVEMCIVSASWVRTVLRFSVCSHAGNSQ